MTIVRMFTASCLIIVIGCNEGGRNNGEIPAGRKRITTMTADRAEEIRKAVCNFVLDNEFDGRGLIISRVNKALTAGEVTVEKNVICFRGMFYYPDSNTLQSSFVVGKETLDITFQFSDDEDLRVVGVDVITGRLERSEDAPQ